MPASAQLAVEVDGQVATLRRGAVVLRAVPADGIDVVLRGSSKEPLTVLDVSPGVPAGAPIAQAVLAARPASAVQTQEGDVTIVSSSFVF